MQQYLTLGTTSQGRSSPIAALSLQFPGCSREHYECAVRDHIFVSSKWRHDNHYLKKVMLQLRD